MNKNTKNSAKAPKIKKEKKPKIIIQEAKVKLLSFSISAVIPTMMYGNISPTIIVEAPSIEEAQAFVLPVIENLYQTYVGPAQDGKMPVFINKANVTAVEKKVDVTPPTTTAPKNAVVSPSPSPKTPAQASVDALADDLTKSPAFTKAENAIKNCASEDALGMIEAQIQKSEKLTAEEKPVLLTIVLKKRKQFAL